MYFKDVNSLKAFSISFRKTIMDNFTAKIMEELQELEKDIVTLKSSEEQAMVMYSFNI